MKIPEKYTTKQLNSGELRIIADNIPMSLFRWARRQPFLEAREDGIEVLRGLAALHAQRKAILAGGRLRDYKEALSRGPDMMRLRPELGYRSAAEAGAHAAGHLAVAKLMANWYSLERDELESIPRPFTAADYAAGGNEDLQFTVATSPSVFGLRPCSGRDVFLDVAVDTERALERGHLSVLEERMAFPLWPQYAE